MSNTDVPYNKREIDIKFQSVIDKVDEVRRDTRDQIEQLSKNEDYKHLQNSEILKAIDVKVSITNGKVKKSEIWQKALTMAGSVAVCLGSVIIGLVVYIYQYQLTQQATRITNLRLEVQQLQTK